MKMPKIKAPFDTLNLIPPGKKLPFQRAVRPYKASGCVFTLLSLFFIGFGVVFMIACLSDPEAREILPAIFFGVIGIVPGLGLFALGFRRFSVIETWRFTQESVSFRSRDKRKEEWSQPLSAYRGIVIDSFHIPGSGSNNRGTTVFMLILVHKKEKSRSVKLYQKGADKDLRREQERYALLLNSPVLEKTPEGIRERRPEDVSKSVRELVGQGVLPVEFDPNSRPPGDGLRVSVEGHFLKITDISTRASPGCSLAFIAAGVVGVIPLIIGIKYHINPLMVMGGLIGVMGPYIGISARHTREELYISPEEVRSQAVTFGIKSSKQRVRAEDIEEVVARSNMPVEVITDGLTLQFGGHLSKAQNEWVRDCIVAVISSLPNGGPVWRILMETYKSQ